MMGGITATERHRSRWRGVKPRYRRDGAAKKAAEARRVATAVVNGIARNILHAASDQAEGYDMDKQLTLDHKTRYKTITRSEVMFSLIILGPSYGLQADHYDDVSYTFTVVPKTS